MSKKNNQIGFSLIELLITMVVMLIVMASVFSLMRGSISTANANYEMTSATQGLRNAQEYLMRDLLAAGDGFKGISNVWLPTPFVSKYLTARTPAVLDPNNLGFVNTGTLVSDNNVPAGVNIYGSSPSITVTSIKPNSDRLDLMTVDPFFDPVDIPVGTVNVNSGRIAIPLSRIADFQIGEVYYITSGDTGVFGTVTSVDTTNGAIFWSDGDPLGLNRLGSKSLLAAGISYGTTPSSLRRVNIISYFVDADSRLIRRAFGVQNVGFIDSVIAEHLVSLQCRYIMEPSTNDKVFEQPVSSMTLDQSTRVRIVESTVSVETAYVLQDGQKHQVESTNQVAVRNIQFLSAPAPVDAQGDATLPNPGPTPYLTPPPPPTPTPMPTATKTPSTTPTPMPTATKTPSTTPTPTPMPSPVPTLTPTPTPTPFFCISGQKVSTGCTCQAPLAILGSKCR